MLRLAATRAAPVIATGAVGAWASEDDGRISLRGGAFGVPWWALLLSLRFGHRRPVDAMASARADPLGPLGTM